MRASGGRATPTGTTTTIITQGLAATRRSRSLPDVTYRDIQVERQAALDAQYRRHPERFVQGAPVVAAPPASVTINPIDPEALRAGESSTVNFPTLNVAKGLVKTTLSSP